MNRMMTSRRSGQYPGDDDQDDAAEESDRDDAESDVEHETKMTRLIKMLTSHNDMSMMLMSLMMTPHQGRRSLWDRGTRPPNIWTGGTLSRMPPPQYF